LDRRLVLCSQRVGFSTSSRLLTLKFRFGEARNETDG
jgi:hypothetical protein